jgi:hypothetical protein
MRKEFLVIALVVAVALMGYLSWQQARENTVMNASAPQQTAPAPATTGAPAAARQNAPATPAPPATPPAAQPATPPAQQ